MLTLQEAASRAGVSEKTLRRAVSSGKLIAHQRETGGSHNNQPLMIEEQDLERYIASRQVQASTPAQTAHTSGLESRIAELEQTIARMQEQASIDHKLAYARIDRLEQQLREHEIALQDTQDLLIKLKETRHQDDTKTAPQETSTPAPTEQATFELADFTQLLLHEYRSWAVRGDVRAWLTLRPEPQGIQGDYRVDYWEYGRIDGKRGKLKRDQETRGEQLKADLKIAVIQATHKAGWTEGPHGIFVCPKMTRG